MCGNGFLHSHSHPIPIDLFPFPFSFPCSGPKHYAFSRNFCKQKPSLLKTAIPESYVNRDKCVVRTTGKIVAPYIIISRGRPKMIFMFSAKK